ncbi:hypothetical protein BLNAU_9721 [Blattamonas nauphoetae]|uniref:Uncharacterized protein n=1 Tax=Blattamonas nauphoetae TaxID=2049346 RepID=A0ABQ9XV31_9EUKA|nr:hypothetical protein BLNAU_23095 [Blattamonas nauphoetae]KAK2947125.1 hypothetical protein BLNAU_17977 [Blattamonas nauphoetae]KAK2955330.1 hypothetical protein BLNAU_9721 [Blattamonas nauphoetae]
MCNAAWIDAVRTVAEQRNTNSDESTARKGSVGEWWGVSEENGEDEGRRGARLVLGGEGRGGRERTDNRGIV